jgi:hypothetical protein
MDYLQKTQYANGGWPQCYPWPRGYSRYITFNDDAMIGAMRLLRDVVEKAKPFEFVDAQHRQKAVEALEKGVECILKCQISTNRPIFCSRDGVIRYKLSEISYERRNGYGWYTDRPGDLLNKRYPAWQKKWAPKTNVLK